MTVKEITNKIKHILEELSYPSAVAYLTLNDKKWLKAAIKALEQEPCEDAISRTEVIKSIDEREDVNGKVDAESVRTDIVLMQPVNPQPKIGHCKDCKYFEYDSVAKVDGIPLIVAHEICSRWGDGCKTKEDGYCFMFEPQERSGEE